MESVITGHRGRDGTRRWLTAVARSARDLILIVVGVLLALGAESWREARQDGRAERALLRAMRTALVNDRQALEDGIAGFERTEAACVALLDHLRESKPYNPSLDTLFGQVYSVGAVPPLNAAPYEALKARGLELVKHESLRLKIIEVYENTYGAIARQNDWNVGVAFDVLRPYYLEHFGDLRFGDAATPISYGALRSDQSFRNILAYRADFLRRAMIEVYRTSIAEIDALVETLDRELEAGEEAR